MLTKSSPPSTGYDVIREAPGRLTEVPSQSSEKYAQVTGSSGPYHAVEVNNNNHQDNNWSTELLSCSLDGDSCWWSSWCCCLVSARNAATFNLGSSIVEVRNVILFLLIIYILVLELTSAVSIVLALLLAVIGLVWYAYRRSTTRTSIRRHLHIPGSGCEDFVFHLFLPCCTIAQEAREADIKIDKKLDLISGDDLSSIVFPHHQSNHLNNRSASDSDSSSESSLSSSLLSRLNTVSSTSRGIITLSMLVAIRFLVSIVLFGDPLNIAVLVLLFAQPLLILYLFYWRYHRSHASLDYVIKLFAVGFFMSTFQSVVFETILETILGFVFVILLMLVDPQVVRTKDKNAGAVAASSRSLLEALLPSSSSGMADPASSLRLRQLVQSTVHVMHGGLHANAAAKGSHGSQDDGGIFSPHVVRRNFPLVVVALLVMAFVIAAGVEETMKHFAIRCCRFPAALRDPHSIRIYLMTAALGFATAENIEYVFGSKGSPFAGTSAFEGELLILLLRIAMPVHIICSVLQSITLSKVLMGLSNNTSIVYVSSTTEHIYHPCFQLGFNTQSIHSCI